MEAAHLAAKSLASTEQLTPVDRPAIVVSQVAPLRLRPNMHQRRIPLRIRHPLKLAFEHRPGPCTAKNFVGDHASFLQGNRLTAGCLATRRSPRCPNVLAILTQFVAMASQQGCASRSLRGVEMAELVDDQCRLEPCQIDRAQDSIIIRFGFNVQQFNGGETMFDGEFIKRDDRDRQTLNIILDSGNDIPMLQDVIPIEGTDLPVPGRGIGSLVSRR
jgi:hypothetical protein